MVTDLSGAKTKDLQGIIQKAMTQDEVKELKRTHLMAGLSEEAVAGELNTNMRNKVNPRHTLKEGTRVLFWIWWTVLRNELGEEDKQVE
jgi:hypothetical protein